jgi:hypothetical protein
MADRTYPNALRAACELADLSADTPLEVVGADGQSRLALPGETYDLNSGATFRTAL